MAAIGFIGLGRMGRPMASGMQPKGLTLLVCGVLEEEEVALAPDGVIANGNPGALVVDIRAIGAAGADKIAAAPQQAGMPCVYALIAGRVVRAGRD